MSEEKKISVKINGRSQSFKEVSEKDEHSLDDIHEQLENVIDFKKRKQERERNRQPYWDDGNHENIPKLPFHKRKKKRLFSEFKKLPLTLIVGALSAIIIGLGLGFMLLTIFTGDSEELAASAQPQPEVEAKEVAVSAGEEMTVSLIQVGAFSDLVKGKEMVKIIGQKGFAPFLKEDAEPRLLFAGIATERGQAEKLQEMIQLAGFETFIKTEQVVVTGDEAGSAMLSIYESLLHMTERGLIEGKVDTDELASIQLKLSEQNFGQAEIVKQLRQVVQILENDVRSHDKQKLWQAQGALIEIVFSLNRLR